MRGGLRKPRSPSIRLPQKETALSRGKGRPLCWIAPVGFDYPPPKGGERERWQADNPPAQYRAKAYAAFLKSSVVAAMRFEIGWNIALASLTIASVFFEPCATAVSKPLRANSP